MVVIRWLSRPRDTQVTQGQEEEEQQQQAGTAAVVMRPSRYMRRLCWLNVDRHLLVFSVRGIGSSRGVLCGFCAELHD